MEFNKEALEALDEHREAEEMARVASPKVRIVLGAMVAMMAVVVYWCIFGTINYKVTAQGIVFPFSEATSVYASEDGTVARCLQKHGAAVAEGTPILEVRHELDTSVVTAPRSGVVISTLPLGTEFKAGEPTAWLLTQNRERANREMLCYVAYDDLRKLAVGQQVQAGRELRIGLHRGAGAERQAFVIGCLCGSGERNGRQQEGQDLSHCSRKSLARVSWSMEPVSPFPRV